MLYKDTAQPKIVKISATTSEYHSQSMSKLHTAPSDRWLYLHVNYMATELYVINTIISVT